MKLTSPLLLVFIAALPEASFAGGGHKTVTATCDCDLTKGPSFPGSDDDAYACTCVKPGNSGTPMEGTTGHIVIDNRDCLAGRDGTVDIYLECKQNKSNDKYGYALNWNLYHGSRDVSCSTKSISDGDTIKTKITCKNTACSKDKSVDLNWFSCSDYSVSGEWKFVKQISTTGDYEMSQGQKRAVTNTKQTTWADSVTASGSAGIEVEGVGVSGTISDTMSKTVMDSVSKTLELTTTETFTSKFGEDQVGQKLYQWMLYTTDPWGEVTETYSPNLAFVPAGGDPDPYQPRCVPGYIYPDKNNALYCCTGGCLPGEDDTSTYCQNECKSSIETSTM